LFQAVCQKDLEGIVAKAAHGLYQPQKTTWVKIKNQNYSQAAGRRDFFDVRRKPASRFGKTPLSLGENVGRQLEDGLPRITMSARSARSASAPRP
jgi:hypothetical protein